jgi:hypothetical protein
MKVRRSESHSLLLDTNQNSITSGFCDPGTGERFVVPVVLRAAWISGRWLEREQLNYLKLSYNSVAHTKREL